MQELEFERESYGRPKLMRPIHKGVQEFGAQPRLPFCSIFFCLGTQCSVSDSPKTP